MEAKDLKERQIVYMVGRIEMSSSPQPPMTATIDSLYIGSVGMCVGLDNGIELNISINSTYAELYYYMFFFDKADAIAYCKKYKNMFDKWFTEIIDM